MTNPGDAAPASDDELVPSGVAERGSDRTPQTVIDERLAGWTHAWAAAASQTYEVIESIWDDESPATAIGRRDAMSMVLVDAARNVLRGTEALLGEEDPVVERFVSENPVLKIVRDCLEHFDDYVRGSGLRQRVDGKWRGDPLSLEAAGMDIPSSHGGGPEGHVVQLTVTERGADGQSTTVSHAIPTRTVAVAVRQLARDMLNALGLLDERHLERCEICREPHDI